MRLAIGHPTSRSKPAPCTAFTMVELVIVMTIMVIAIGVAAPSFKEFLRGRSQEDEARRFLSLTRYGLNRAVSEGLPVDLWINTKENKYGMAAARGYTETMTNVSNFIVDKDVQMMVSRAPDMLTTQSNFWTPSFGRRSGLPVLRFQPDGFISDISPQAIRFLQGEYPEIWIVENSNHMRYDIILNHAKVSRF